MKRTFLSPFPKIPLQCIEHNALRYTIVFPMQHAHSGQARNGNNKHRVHSLCTLGKQIEQKDISEIPILLLLSVSLQFNSISILVASHTRGKQCVVCRAWLVLRRKERRRREKGRAKWDGATADDVLSMEFYLLRRYFRVHLEFEFFFSQSSNETKNKILKWKENNAHTNSLHSSDQIQCIFSFLCCIAWDFYKSSQCSKIFIRIPFINFYFRLINFEPNNAPFSLARR